MKSIVSDALTRQEMETRVLARLFEDFAKAGIRYAVLRNYASLPEAVGSRDIDMVVHPADLKRTMGIVLALSSDFGCLLSHLFRDDMFTSIWLYRRLDEDQIFTLALDFFPGRRVYGVDSIPAEAYLARVNYHRGIPVVRDPFVFLDKWLYHLVVGRPSPTKYDATFAEIAGAEFDELHKILTPLLGIENARDRLEQVRAGAASQCAPLSAKARLSLVLRGARGHLPAAPGRIARFVGYRIRDRVKMRGTLISISGPDGCGKTTVINLVIAELKQIQGLDGVWYRHFRPATLPRIAEFAKAARAVEVVDENYDRPHRAQPSGMLGSLARLGYYWLDYLVGYLRAVRPELLRGRVVLFDRYAFDMICDPGRSRIALPATLLRTVIRLLPLPRWAFFIRVAPEEVFRRKQELDLDTIRQLNARYDDLVRRGMLIAVDNDGQVPEKAAAQVVDTIITQRDLKARQALGKLCK